MVKEIKVDRRRLLGMGGTAVALAALAPAGPAFAQRANKGARLVRDDKMGTIIYTQRDVRTRRGIWNNPEPTMGHLGGPNFPHNPDDLGPLVPLPGGFYELFEFLAGVGFRQIEFAGYTQHADNRGGNAPNWQDRAAYIQYARTLRGFLDEFGLEAIGNHGFIPGTWPGGPDGGMNPEHRERYLTELEFAATLGMPFMGTGGDPTNSSQKEAWDTAAEKWTALNELSRRTHNIHLYPHNHADVYNFLQDGPEVQVTQDLVTGDPLPEPQMVRSSSGVRRMQYYLDITPRNLCYAEIDIYWAHVAQHRFQWYYDANGNRVHNVLDPLETVRSQSTRFPLYHAKDGDRTDQAPGVGNGYSIIPFGHPSSDIDYRTFFQRQRANGYHNPNYEQDNAPGGGADPGKSLRDSHFSAANMMALTGRRG